MRLEPDNNIMKVLEGQFQDLDVDLGLPAEPKVAPSVSAQAVEDLAGLASAAKSEDEDQGGSGTALAHQDLPWAEYLQRFKETFIKAKPLDTVKVLAANMGFVDWLGYCVKLMPKDIKIQGEVNFRHLVAEFGPIDKSQYRLEEPVVDVIGEVVEDHV